MDFDVASIPADAVILEAKLTLYSMTPQTNDDYRHSSSLNKTKFSLQIQCELY